MKVVFYLFLILPLTLAFTTGCKSGSAAPGIYVAPTGDDTAVGDAAHPLATVAAAIQRSGDAGGVIRLAPGVYHERIAIAAKATESAPLSIEGAVSKKGERLSILDGSVPLEAAQWTPRPEIGPGVYAYPVAAPRLLLVEGRTVARLHHEAGFSGEPTYRAEEVLAWPSDHREITHYRKESIPFWETIGGVYTPSPDGKEVYLRLSGGRDPRQIRTAIASAGATVSLNGAQHVRLCNLAVRGGDVGVEIGGKDASSNTVENCFITHGRRRIRVADGANQTLLKGNRIESGALLGQLPGTWGIGNARDPLAARKEFIYLYFKYWASGVHISDDVSIIMERGSRGTVVEANQIEEGVIGIGLYGGDDVTVRGNTIRHFSSVGTVIRDGGDVAVYDGNLFEDCNINIRLHDLNGTGPQRHLWFLRNVSRQQFDTGSHIFCYFRPGSHPYPDHQILFAQNTFIGGGKGLSLPLPSQAVCGLRGFQFVNNRFIGCGYALYGRIDWFQQRAMFGHFDYNQIIGGEIGRHGIPPWYGAHNIDDTKAIGWQVSENGVRLPNPDRGRGAGVNITESYNLDGVSFPALSGLMPGIDSGTKTPDLGAPAPLPPAIGQLYDN